MSHRAIMFLNKANKWQKTYNPNDVPKGATFSILKSSHERPVDDKEEYNQFVEIDGKDKFILIPKYWDFMCSFGRIR